MKNLIILLFLSTTFSFALNGQNELAQKNDRQALLKEVLQTSLGVNYLSKAFKKDESGDFLPVIILSNGFFAANFELEFEGQPVQIIIHDVEEYFEEKTPHLDVTKMKIKNRKSDFEFEYCGTKFSIELKKRDGIWKHRKTSAKGNGNRYVHVEF